ncbi:MAG: oligosaccharide flippase family protein, partial [Bacilli bacterium]
MKNRKINSKLTITISVVISYVTLFVSIILAVIYTPYVLEVLGDVEYGIRAFATSLVGYLAFLSFGMAPSYLRFANLMKKERGEEGERHINGIFLLFYLIASGLALLIGGVVILLIMQGVIPLNNYTSGEQSIIIIIMAITVIGTMIEFPGIFMNMILTYRKKFIWINTVSLVITVLSPVISILVLSLGGRAVAITWVAFGIAASTVIANSLYVFFSLKTKLTFRFDAKDKILFKRVIAFSAIVFIISTLTQMSTITDKVILGFILGAEAVTLLQISTIFNSYLNSIAVSITGLFAPRLTEDAVNGRMDDVQYVHDFVIKVISILLCMIVFGFASAGKEFVQAWIGVEKVDVYYYSLTILGSSILLSSQTFSFYIQRALNKNLIPAIIYIATFVIHVG